VDGTLVFVDVSGFTALSERLAQRGKVGAEQLTDVLNSVFGTMLGLAAARGGSLLKFGGDALFLLFTGPDHAVQAACATVEMRAALAATAKTPGPAGRLRLRMSVGVHTGEVDLFLVGASHRELVIVGPATTAVASMEAAASAGQILVGPDTAAALPAGAVGDPLGPGYLLRWRRAHADPGQAGLRALDDRDVSRFVPTALRAVLGAGDPESEHRTVGVSFVRYTGIDTLLEQQGHQTTADALHRLVSAAQSCADTEGVTFLATDLAEDGGKVILVAGFPTTADDDQGRLLRASRHVVQRSLAEAWPIGVRAGLNRGHVFAGAIGSQERATVTVMGDTVNLAARVMAKAETGQVLATPATLDNAQTLFATHPVEPFMVKGKSRPVTAYLVAEETGTRPPRGLGSLPFLGRDTELTAITAAIDALADGRGGVVSLVGDAGMGKTRLLREALTTTEGITTLQARAEPYGTATPYRPVRDPLRNLLGLAVGPKDGLAQTLVLAIHRLAPDLTAWAPLIGEVLGIPLDPTDATTDLDPEFRPDRTADAVIELIHAAVSGPLVVAFDDAHYSDDATSLLASRLERETAQRPWLLLLARRDERTGYLPSTGVSLAVGPLANDTVQALVYRATAAAPLRSHTVEGVVARVAGNPLFLEETLRNLREHGDIDSLPTSLEGMVAAQIDALSPLARRVARRASVLGRSFRTSILRDLFADDDITLDDATLTELADILEPDGTARLRFRHALLRDAAYDSLPFVQRRALHLAAAHATLARSGNDPSASADSLALHYSMGGDMASTWTWARVAGDRARDAYAYPVAALQYRRALRASDRLDSLPSEEVLALCLALGDVSGWAGDFPTALDSFRRAARWAPTAEGRARVLLRQARANERLTRYSAALADLTRAERELNGSVSAEAACLRVEATAFRAAVLCQQDRFSLALAVADKAVVEARALGAKAALATALERKEIALQMLGRPTGGRHAREALALYRELDDLNAQQRVVNNLGAFDFYAGDWTSALAEYQRAADLTRRLGNDVEAAISDANSGEILVLQGKYDDARPLLEASSRVLRAADFIDGASFSDVQLARVYLAQGDLTQARTLLDAVINELTASGKLDSALEAAIARAEVALAVDEPEQALTILSSSLDGARKEAQMLLPQLAKVRAMALFALGHVDEAAAACAEGLAEARDLGLGYEQARLSLLAASHGVQPLPPGALAPDEAVSTLRALGVDTASLP
jgi:class 3 adenylate cyclase/predicted ATPase